MTDSYIYIITALMPLVASLLVFQANPYHALVIRGILGAISALIYAMLGAPDVALTEALVGTLLAITLYAVAIRSSMVVRLGVLKSDEVTEPLVTPVAIDEAVLAAEIETNFSKIASSLQLLERLRPDLEVSAEGKKWRQLFDGLQETFAPYHLQLDVVYYPTLTELQKSLGDREVHAIAAFAIVPPSTDPDPIHCSELAIRPFTLQTRLHRLYEIMQSSAVSDMVYLNYIAIPTNSISAKEAHP